jgi:hypothetical protein
LAAAAHTAIRQSVLTTGRPSIVISTIPDNSKP